MSESQPPTQRPFAIGHATHPDGRMALSLVLAQLDAQAATTAAQHATWGLLYITDAYAPIAESLLETLRERTGVTHWVGASGVGLIANEAEYLDEPALAVMLADTPPEQFQVFSGQQPLAKSIAAQAWNALVHADPNTPDLPGLVPDLPRKLGGRVWGALASARQGLPLLAEQWLSGGVSGIAFAPQVALALGVSQGCQTLGGPYAITRYDRNQIQELGGRPALEVLFEVLQIEPAMVYEQLRRREATEDPLMRSLLQQLRSTLIGLGSLQAVRQSQYQARHLMGIDPAAQAIVVGQAVEDWTHAVICRRDPAAARTDLTRLCAELRETLEDAGQSPRGAVYLSCVGRTGQLFGGPSAEAQWLRHQWPGVPTIGLYASGELADDALYGYTGVLGVFA